MTLASPALNASYAQKSTKSLVSRKSRPLANLTVFAKRLHTRYTSCSARSSSVVSSPEDGLDQGSDREDTESTSSDTDSYNEVATKNYSFSESGLLLSVTRILTHATHYQETQREKLGLYSLNSQPRFSSISPHFYAILLPFWRPQHVSSISDIRTSTLRVSGSAHFPKSVLLCAGQLSGCCIEKSSLISRVGKAGSTPPLVRAACVSCFVRWRLSQKLDNSSMQLHWIISCAAIRIPWSLA